jgi:heme-degrading monooxygenase HmoA
MHARVTQLEIDTTRIDMDYAVQLFRAEVLPAVREQEGYQGTYVLANPDGKALLLTFWETEEEAEAHAPTGQYSEHLAQFSAIFSAPPGRDRYAVLVADQPVGIEI